MEGGGCKNNKHNQQRDALEMVNIAGVEEVCTRGVCMKKVASSIQKLSMSPQCKELYKLHKNAKKLDYCKRVDMALKTSQEESFKQVLEGMNSVTRKCLWSELKLSVKYKKRKQFSLNEKLIALSILKRIPKYYSFLQIIFILPCKIALNKLLEHVKIEEGIHPQVFNVIKTEVRGWKEVKKMCSVVFDDIRLETGDYFKQHEGGIVELSEEIEYRAGGQSHALTFMLKGVVYNWQQPMAFYLSEVAATGAQIKAIIKAIVTAVCETGLQPIALTSNQGILFQNAFRSLQKETRRSQILAGEETDDTIHINGQCLSVLYDPPYLMKGIRNNFLIKDIQMNGKTCKWQDLVQVYCFDRPAKLRILNKLHDDDILPEKIEKSKVKNCTKVFSNNMAGILSFTSSCLRHNNGSHVSTTMANTAALVAFLDELFDSVTGTSAERKHAKKKPLRTAVTKNSIHHAFWTKAIQTIENIKFVNKHGEMTSARSLNNWVTTLKSYQRLWQVFNKKNIKSMLPGYFNLVAREVCLS